MYWVAGDSGTVKASKAGGSPVVLASGPPYSNLIAVDATSVYWGTGNGVNDIVSGWIMNVTPK